MKYQIRSLFKSSEEDNWEQGCLPNTGASFSVDVSFSADSVDGAIKAAAEFLDIPDGGIERNACEEIGRVDFARTENENGEALTDRETEEWKAGKRKAWYCVYSGFVESVQRVSA